MGSAVSGNRHVMLNDWEQQEDVFAAGTSCPMPDCGALTLAYRLTDHGRSDDAEPWESVPKDRLLADVHAA
jgi:hypothetical protein